jgi:hypothetical protein
MDTSLAGQLAVRTQTPTAKIMPARLPAVLVTRPDLLARLDEVTSRRLTTVVAGAGFGKSTLLAAWAVAARPAWYALHPEDEALPTFLHGLLDALRLRLPGLPAGGSTVLGRSLGPDVDDLARADDVAAVLGELLDRELPSDLVLVVDDVHELRPGGPSARLLAGLCRHAPPGLHVVLASRAAGRHPADAAAPAADLLAAADRTAAADLLAAAEAGYAGDFLADDPYEDWAAPLREEARAAYLAVARALAERAAAAGEHDLAVRYHLRVLERDGYDEAAHLGLVRTLTAAGRHGEARRRYRFYVERMDEIGVETEPFPAGPAQS